MGLRTGSQAGVETETRDGGSPDDLLTDSFEEAMTWIRRRSRAPLSSPPVPARRATERQCWSRTWGAPGTSFSARSDEPSGGYARRAPPRSGTVERPRPARRFACQEIRKMLTPRQLIPVRAVGNSLTVEKRTLTPSVLVRIQVPQPAGSPEAVGRMRVSTGPDGSARPALHSLRGVPCNAIVVVLATANTLERQ